MAHAHDVDAGDALADVGVDAFEVMENGFFPVGPIFFEEKLAVLRGCAFGESPVKSPDGAVHVGATGSMSGQPKFSILSPTIVIIPALQVLQKDVDNLGHALYKMHILPVDRRTEFLASRRPLPNGPRNHLGQTRLCPSSRRESKENRARRPCILTQTPRQSRVVPDPCASLRICRRLPSRYFRRQRLAVAESNDLSGADTIGDITVINCTISGNIAENGC